MESIEQPFDNITHMGRDPTETRDHVELIDSDARAKPLFNGDSPRAESSPLHQGKSTNSLLHGPQNHGLRVIIVSSIVFALAVTVALILTIYLEPTEIHGHASVACDDSRCSLIGLQVLKDGGNAVDAVVAAAFCQGVVNPAHSGLGGGGFALVHDHKYMRTSAYDFRETAPGSLTSLTEADAESAVSTGVPGMLKGLMDIHNEHGSLPWKDLVTPAIELADSEYSVNEQLVKEIFPWMDPKDFVGTRLGAMLLKSDGTFKTLEDNMTFPEYARTLEKIQQDPASFYTGAVAAQIAKAIQNQNGQITAEDLKNYSVSRPNVLKSKFQDLTLVSIPPPAGGAVVSMILNIVDKLKWTEKMKHDPLMYHQLIETFRYAFAHKNLLGDPKFNPGVAESVKDIMADKMAEQTAEQIKAINKTFPDPAHYGPGGVPGPQRGTTHISIMDSAEVMVAMTLSLNYNFGNHIMLDSGIILNNELMDFDLTPNSKSPNIPEPGKRPQSSMCPLIVYNEDHPCEHRLILGGSNGSRVITGVSEVLINSLVFKMNISEAVKAPRITNELGTITAYDKGIPAGVIKALTEMGYNLQEAQNYISLIQAIEKTNDNINGVSDPRAYGKAAHF